MSINAQIRSSIPIRDRLILALDYPESQPAEELVRHLEGRVDFYKIGMQLQFNGGIDLARRLVERGKRIFLDSKLLDIDETIAGAVANIARIGVSFLTVHGTGATIRAAVRGRGGHDLRILAVTALTSLDAADLRELGVEIPVKEYVLRRTQSALSAGCDGVIASGLEAAPIRELAGDRLLIVTPGIRSPGVAHDDQKRVSTPEEAIAAGADYLVVGREITQALDPISAAENIFAQIDAGLKKRKIN